MKATFVVDIGRSARGIYDLLSNHENDARWQSIVVEVTRLSPGIVRAGSRFRHTLSLLGRRLDCEIEVTRTQPVSLHSFSIAGGPFAFETRTVLTPAGSGTRVHVEVDGHANGLAKVAAVTLSRLRQVEIERDLRRLKRMMEAGEL